MRIFAFVAAQKADFPVRTLCRVCQVSVSGFYAWVARMTVPPSPAAVAKVAAAAHIARVYRESRRRYGSPRVTVQLAREGIVVNHKAVEREMARQGLAGRCSHSHGSLAPMRRTGVSRFHPWARVADIWEGAC